MTDDMGNPIEHDPPGPSGPIDFGLTKVIAFGSVDEPICNPFSVSRDESDESNLVINEVLISVQRPGKAQVMAQCQWTSVAPVFLSDPVPE